MIKAAKVLLRTPDQHFLLLERSSHPVFANDPDLPGGTVEEGEEPRLAAIREVEEETGIDISFYVVAHLYTGNEYSRHNTLYSLYIVDIATRPEVVISWEHASYKWVTLEELINRSGAATDTYMHLVHDIVSQKQPYLTTWQSGRESKLLDDIIAGRKTIEGRLNKGKFAQYQVGETVSLRRDHRDEDGMLHDGEPDAARVEITAIRRYGSFLEMVTEEGYEKVIPGAHSPQEAANEYNKFYSAEDQAKYGVLAIEVHYLAPNLD